MKVLRTTDFARWLKGLDGSVKARVLARLSKMENEGYFGQTRDLGGKVSELKWKQALRVYYTLIKDKNGDTCICLLGGDKDGQNDDIEKAKTLAAEIHG